jgi:hypothetical protein
MAELQNAELISILKDLASEVRQLREELDSTRNVQHAVFSAHLLTDPTFRKTYEEELKEAEQASKENSEFHTSALRTIWKRLYTIEQTPKKLNYWGLLGFSAIASVAVTVTDIVLQRVLPGPWYSLAGVIVLCVLPYLVNPRAFYRG